MKLRDCFLILFLAAVSIGLADGAEIHRWEKLELEGKFREAARVIQDELARSNQSEAIRQNLRFELDRLERIRKDYPFTRESLFARLQESVRALTRAEFEQWIAEGRFDRREIDGEERFMGSSISNLFFRYPELNPRRLPPKDTAKFDRTVWETARAIKQAARESGRPYVTPKRYHAVMTVTVKSNVVPAGETIRAWLPVPREFPFQTGFELESSSAPMKHLAAGDSSIRSVYLEQPARANDVTKFQIAYEYTTHGIFFDVDPAKVRRADRNDPALRPFLSEAPHVVFTPKLRELSAKIVGNETNSAIIAKRCYEWIATNIKYSYALEYGTIRNISDYCLNKGYGDCGQEALLFIALCRLNDIPARWQSGWHFHPGGKTIHDWCEIYLAPYGWMPVDPYMGIWAAQYSPTLNAEQKKEVRDFYFGGLDAYRLAANSDHNQELSPAKNSFRSDPVDFQRGELEWGTNNIYFDQYRYELDLKEQEVRSE